MALLEVKNLVKHFVAGRSLFGRPTAYIKAVDGVSFFVEAGKTLALVGESGCGKTTLGRLVLRLIDPTAGRIRFDGREITNLPAYRRSRLGLARSFQVTTLFPDFTALDNIALSVQAHAGHSFRFWQNARDEPELREPAQAALARVGLIERASALVADLSHGERRQLEIAMALAARPRMLLLDEPMAGMGLEESARLLEMLRALKGSITVILIEHDIDAVFALADRISVLVYGRIIASGDPAAIRADPGVREAYLGEGAVDG